MVDLCTMMACGNLTTLFPVTQRALICVGNSYITGDSQRRHPGHVRIDSVLIIGLARHQLSIAVKC